MSAKKGATSSESPLEMVMTDFNRCWSYTQGSWHQRWENNNKLYNNQRVNYGYEGITDTFVPMAYSTVETFTSGLFGAKPKFNFTPPKQRPDQKTDILNSLLDFYWELDQWGLKTINTGRNTFKLGHAIDYFYWEGDHPCMINVPIRDFFFDPNASELAEGRMRYCGRRYLTTKEELESFEIVDLDAEPDEFGNYPMKKKYTNLDQINANAGSKGENTDKQEKDMLYGATVSDAESTLIEVIEYWTLDKTISVANRSVVIEDSEIYFKAKDRQNQLAQGKADADVYAKGLLPFADSRDLVDESLYLAKGEIDVIADQQELLNDITNQNIDAVTYSLNPMYTLDPKYSHQINDVENLPGAVYPFEAGALQPIQMAAIPNNAFNERLNIKNEIRETTGSNEVVKGVGTQEAGATTATEINAQVAGAGQRFTLKVTQLENGYFYRVAKIVFRMIQLYVTEPMMVRIMGKDGAKWELFDPSEFQGEYEPRIQLEATIQNEKQDQANNAKELLAAFLGDPTINQLELKKMVLTKSFNLDPDEVELLTTPVPGQGLAPEMGMPMDGGLPPELAGLPPELAGQPPIDAPVEMPAEMPVEPIPAGVPV